MFEKISKYCLFCIYINTWGLYVNWELSSAVSFCEFIEILDQEEF